MTAIRPAIRSAIQPAIRSAFGAAIWDPLTLFAASEQGVWYDPSDFSTLYQDSKGTTPVTAVGQPAGLILDKRKGLVSSSKRGYLVGTEAPFSTPSAAALNITGDIDLRAYIHPMTWTDTRVINKDNLGASRNYGLVIKADKKIVLEYGAGGTYYTNTSSAASSGAADVPIWVRATLDVDNGAGGRTSRFYTSTDGSTWAELGTPVVTAGTVALDTGTAVLEVGGNDVRNVNLNGAVIRAQVLSGIDGTVVADFNPTLYTGGSTFTAATGETWTVNAGCFIAPEGNHAYQATAASRPILRHDGTNYYLEFDGVDDSLATAAINFSATQLLSFFAGIRKIGSSAASGVLTELTASSANLGSFSIFAPNSGTESYLFIANGGAGTGYIATTYTAPITNVIACNYNLAANSNELKVIPRINGATPGTLTVAGGVPAGGAQTFANAAMYIGRRGGTTLPLNGRIYSLIVLGRTATALEIAAAESYAAGKSGVVLP